MRPSMSVQRIKIPRVADRKIAETFTELGKKFATTHAHVNALAFSDIGQINLTGEPVGDWKVLLDHDSSLIESMGCSIGGLTISYARGGQYPSEQKSPIFDEIVLNWHNQGTPTTAQKLDIVAFINSRLHPFEPGRVIGSGVSEEQAQLLAIHQSTLDRLERLNEDLIRQSSEFRKGLEEKFEEKAAQVDAEYAEKKKRLEVDGQALTAQVEAKERALDEKLKAIDDRDNTHVRREIRDRMLDDVKKRISQFGVSRFTSDKRRPVLVGIILLLAVFVGLLGWTGYEINAMDNQYSSMLEAIKNISAWGPEKIKAAGLGADVVAHVSATDVDRTHLFWLWGRFTLFSLGLVGTILYYIKWQNRWAEQHIISEFNLQQFYIDVNRANWVIESCLEWRKVTESAIPKELLGSITTGLFVNNQTEPERVIHPADELASALLGTASKLKLKVGGSELDFDKPKKIPNKPIKVGVPHDE
ncbi:hypothetical protein METUNv1_01250 [Methyloversatilis universalis FAM5]|uniref:Uncharacterized protein n=2 Tax=Methyloversatilis universalis TaxID=378211 RepID=F5RAN6_METUF|nr:hypothetical protein METUNv1_01250 [Methyloversatilis universalis FAM5]